jgi:sporulation protein YlmC with PRC-barrel domain
MAGRVLYAGLHLLDRQLVDRTGRLCGKVDDLELGAPDVDGNRHVAAVLSGPGALLGRTGHRRLGDWLRRAVAGVFAGGDDPVHIPFSRVTEVGNHVTLDMDSEDVATFAAERWVRDHVVRRIPGSRIRADQ